MGLEQPRQNQIVQRDPGQEVVAGEQLGLQCFVGHDLPHALRPRARAEQLPNHVMQERGEELDLIQRVGGSQGRGRNDARSAKGSRPGRSAWCGKTGGEDNLYVSVRGNGTRECVLSSGPSTSGSMIPSR